MKVLHIDDNQDITNLFSEFLKNKGVDIKVTNDPRKGLELIKQEKYDVVLLDIHMPGFYGTDIIQSLENEKILKEQQIIIFSGADLTSNQITSLLKKDGIKSHLKKPVPLNDLFTAIFN
ncbi:MAG: response regulator [Nitrosopumilus sp.]|nr:response regulator [Nitrosopumilus sp.]